MVTHQTTRMNPYSPELRKAIAERIREEHRKYSKHDVLDWAEIAAGKVLATIRAFDSDVVEVSLPVHIVHDIHGIDKHGRLMGEKGSGALYGSTGKAKRKKQ